MNEPMTEHTLVLRLFDRPGAMERIAATFAHRGISLSWTLGNDGSLSPDGYATVIVHFCATATRKEAIKRVLSRLSRIVSVTEPAAGGRAEQMSALLRLCPNAPVPSAPDGVFLSHVATDDTGEAIYFVTGSPSQVTLLLDHLRTAGHIRTLTQITLAL